MTLSEDEAAARSGDAVLAPYVPRLLEEHTRANGSQQLLLCTGTLVSADISGFTALSERLAGFGKEGAEELTDLLNRCFTAMIEACERRGGDVIKFGGDALLVLFDREQHARDAAVAMCEMREIVSTSWSTDSVRSVNLGISQGAHSGTMGFSLTDAGHLELIAGGPAVSATVQCEGDAGRGEILVSAATAELLPPSWLRRPNDSGACPLRTRRVLADSDSDSVIEPSPRGHPGLDRYLADELAEQIVAGVPGEHRQVVIAFVNLSGSDDLFADQGARAVHQAAQTIVANVATVLERHAVHLLASDVYVNGSKLILTAGAPRSTDADEDHMLLALHELFQMPSPLPIRAGVNRGPVFVGDLGGPTRRTYTVMGDAVNLAARLMQRAAPGQIISSLVAIERAETAFELEELEPFMVKGKSEPIRAAILGAPKHTVDNEDHNDDVQFVGRRNELERLEELLAWARGGTGSVVHIGGDVGVGRSRLAHELVAAHPDVRVHRLSGGQYARNTPFLTIRRFLRSLLDIRDDDPVAVGTQLTDWVGEHVPALIRWLPLVAIPMGAEVPMTRTVDRLAEQFRRDRLLMVTADLIDAALDGPAILLADDVDLFDEGSTDVLGSVARRAGQRRWLIVTTGPHERPPLDDGPHRIELGPMSDHEVDELVRAAVRSRGSEDDHVSDDLVALARRGEGNPLFVLELVAAAVDGAVDVVPESIESLITTRIDSLPAAERTLLREVAVGGMTVDTDLVATALGRPQLREPNVWDRLDGFLAVDAPGRYRFRQGIYRDVAYEGLAYRRRRDLHHAIGVTLERRQIDHLDEIAPLLSDHFDRARDHDAAWRYSVIAGDGARRAYANREAITLFERAIRHADRSTLADAQELCRVAEGLGDVCVLMGDHDAALHAYQRSRGWSSELKQEATLLRKIGAVRLREGRLSQSLAWFTRAEKVASRVADSRDRRLESAEIALARAGALIRQGRLPEAAERAEFAAKRAEAADDRLAMARSFNMLEITYRRLGRPGAVEYSNRALEMYHGTGDLVGEANVLNNRGIRHHFAGEWSEAIAEYERSRSLRDDAGDVVGEAMVSNNIAEILSLQGRFDEGLALFAHATSAWRNVGYSVGVGYALSNAAVTQARAGDVEQARLTLGEAMTVLEDLGAARLVSEAKIRRTEIDLIAGDVDAAITHGSALLARVAKEDPDDPLIVQLLPLLGLAQLRSGDHSGATVRLDEGLGRARAAGDRYIEALCRSGLATARQTPEPPIGDGQPSVDKLFVQLGLRRVPAVLLPVGA